MDAAKMITKSIGFISIAAVVIACIVYNHPVVATIVGFFGFLFVSGF